MIDQIEINAVKERVDLKTYIEQRGIVLKKNGKGYMGLCPFHDDKNPSLSVTPESQLWQCFGCGKGGDVIRFVELMDHVDFKQAFHILDNKTPVLMKKPQQQSTSSLSEPDIQKLLERVITVYEKAFEEEGIKYLEQRGITDKTLIDNYRIGYCTGKLTDILPRSGKIRDDLVSTGIMDKSGEERFNGCLVVPVYDLYGNVTTLYGRHFKLKSKRHVLLPNRSTGLWNIAAVKIHPKIILVESVIDALSVMMAGYSNVISIQGTNGLSDADIRLLKEHGVNKTILLLDGDEAGIKASERLKEKINNNNIAFDIKKLPDGYDPNSYLLKYGPEKLGEFIQFSSLTASQVQAGSDGFEVIYDRRRYRIMGLEQSSRKLKATIRTEHTGKLHVDTLDFYSARARRGLIQDICRIFDETPEMIEADVTRLLLECEKQCATPKEPSPAETKEIMEEDRREAEAFGQSCDLIKNIQNDFQTCGLIGEEANKLLGYIAITSRKRSQPLAIQILASSGAGKSALQDAIVAFCPPEDLVKLTSLSGKALFYKEETSLKHKVLALEEGDGAEEATYAIRSLISSGVLISESTIKDLTTGKLTTMESRVEGPTAVFYTTTNPETDPETKSRFFVTGIDESREQTRRILDFQRKNHLSEDSDVKMASIYNKHWNFQRLLKPVVVKNPYADQLRYSDDRLQGRRDQPKYLNLIKSVAFLRQMQKEIRTEIRNGQKVSCIDVDMEDIKIANRLTHEILGKSLDELSRPARELLQQLDEMVSRKEETVPLHQKTFTRRNIRDFTGWSNSRVHRYLKELIELEYVLVETGKNGIRYEYHLAYEGQGQSGERFVLGLTEVSDLKD